METKNEKEYLQLTSVLKKGGSHYDYSLIQKALDVCIAAHEGQFRSSGEPYYSHPMAVAEIVIELGMDTESVCAALLHDVVEDTETTLEDIKKGFGKDVAMLVDGVTKLGKIPLSTKEEEQSENLRKMLIAMAADIRVIIIKLADRLHNMRTLSAMPEQKQRDKSLETLEVYAPIAHRLGIRAIKEELEDLAIAHLDSSAYNEIETLLDRRKQYRQILLNNIRQKIEERISPDIKDVYIEARVKSIHGIYRKMYVQGKTFDEIYDIYAIRVIVDTVTDCYNILGIIHDMFRPIPGRFKDYISTPKPNMYQSLHTTVIGREGIPFEVQIRTWEMHHTAEYGIAAHWKYKQGINRANDKIDDRLTWIRQILDTQNEADDAEELIKSIKIDLSQEDVFAVTPKGDVINLPVGATVVDFAYAIHTEVGSRMVGAKVDGRIVPIVHEIKTGEIIEILTTNQESHGPSRDWLNIAKTSQARNKIRSWFKRERRPENIANGKFEVEKEFSRNGIQLPEENMHDFLLELSKRQHCESLDEFYAAIGYGGLQLQRIMPRIKDEYAKLIKVTKPMEISDLVKEPVESKSSDGIIIEGIDNCLIKLSRCCAPLPGDDIIGFITRGHGVSIHKRDCPNVPENIVTADEADRWIPARWSGYNRETFNSTIRIITLDRPGALAGITIAIDNMHVGINAVDARSLKNGNCVINATISLESVEHLKNICSKIEKMQGVFSVERTSQ